MIKELTTENQWREAFPLVKQLRTHLHEDEYVSLVQSAVNEHHYRIFGVWDGDVLKGVVGFMPMTTLYYGSFIWICDLVTDENARSKGYGKGLLNFVEVYAKEHGFTKVALSSGLQRQDAHRFYEEKSSYDRVSYVFKKDL